MKLNHNAKLFLIGLSPLAAGIIVNRIVDLTFNNVMLRVALYLGTGFYFIWYRVAKDAALSGKNIKMSFLMLNASAGFFIISHVIHLFGFDSYMGSIGSYTQSFSLH